MSDHTQTNLITLSRHFISEQRKFNYATGDLTLVLNSIQVGCKFVETCVRKARLVNLTGLISDGSKNVQGEQVKKLDQLANEIFINSLRSSGKVAMMVSEELEDPIIVDESEQEHARYCVCFDPLDGSSNIEAGVSIGTIFGIFRLDDNTKASAKSVLRPGSELVVAGYCMYGSSCNMVLTTGNGVNGYTLDNAIGEFVLTHPNIVVPKRGNIYSINEGNSMYWDSVCRNYVEHLKNPVDKTRKPYSSRYIGSMVADVHRTLLYGGIFAYPADSKSKNGKLRVLYECFPMAYIIQQAGGMASTGHGPMLDYVPPSIHARSPIFLGSSLDIMELEQRYAAAHSKS